MNKKFISILLLSLSFILIFTACGKGNNKEAALSNEKASEETVSLYKYISSLSGSFTLSAQQESTWMGSADYEIDYIYERTGMTPVIKGFDYMNDDFEGVNERAVQWHNKGGIVTICWHCGSDFSGEWKDCKESDITDWDKALTEGTKEYETLIEGMDKGARALKELQKKGIPVLWRPFHEFDGDWFWWSRGGSESFIKLWQIMYDRYTNHWGLDNLIWVLGYSHKMEKLKRWYPGDEYCDIIGADTYDITINAKLYKKISRVTKAPKPLCLHECGTNPASADFVKAPWTYFMTWHTEYLTNTNSDEALHELYNSDFVLTLEEINR